MLDTAEEKLEYAVKLAASALTDLQATPDKLAVNELLEVCKKLDERYKEFCAEFDQDDNLEPGTTYKEGGLSIEFYIEAGDWHDISVALRKLTQTEGDKHDRDPDQET